MHCNLKSLEQYNDTQFVIKAIYKGEQSEAVMLYLLPGQEMPTHPHRQFEVTLLPRSGTATLTVNDNKSVELKPDVLYYERPGSTFRLLNTGSVPFEVLITLVRVNPRETPPIDPQT